MGQLFMDGLKKISVRATRLEHELLVQKLEYWGSPGFFNHIDSVLIVFKRDILPVDTFLFILQLFKSKHVLVKLLLKLFVGIVNR